MPAQNLPGLVLDRAHPLSRGLAAWWPMNGGGGASIPDISGGLPATMLNFSASATSGWAGGPGGRSVKFDASDDHLTVPHSQRIGGDLTGDWSWSMWVNIASFSNYIWLLAKGAGANAASYQAFVLITTGLIYHRRDDGDGVSEMSVASTAPPTLGKWCHIAGTERSKNVTHYLNGAPNGGGNLGAGTIGDSGGILRIGARSDGYYMNGSMANVRLYNRCLNASEVAQLYADPMAGALAPSRASRLYVAAGTSPPAAIAAPPTADRLWNRGYVGRIFRRGEKG